MRWLQMQNWQPAKWSGTTFGVCLLIVYYALYELLRIISARQLVYLTNAHWIG